MKAIGVSNYDVELLREVVGLGGVVPQVNQVHLTPLNQQRGLQGLAAHLGIHLQAYSSLGSWAGSQIFNHRAVQKIASRLNRFATISIEWLLL